MLAPSRETSGLVGLCLALYPRKWRERYGDEYAALLEDVGLTPAALLDVLTGALDAHIRQRASDHAATRADRALRAGKGLAMGAAIGLMMALAIWVAAVSIEGGRVTAYLVPSPVLLVLGGTISALLIAYGLGEVWRLPGTVLGAVFGAGQGSGAEALTAEARFRLGSRMLRDAARFALLTGTISTVLALVIILSTLDGRGVAAQGHAIAVGVLGLLYGLVLSVLCYALSSQLTYRADREHGLLRALSTASDAEPRGFAVHDQLTPAASAT